jgi:hypothetical protein
MAGLGSILLFSGFADKNGMSLMRVIMRVEVSGGVPNALSEVTSRTGMTQVATVSRLVEWFARQPDVIQAAVLGLYPVDLSRELPRLIIKHMTTETTGRTSFKSTTVASPPGTNGNHPA